MLVVDDGEGGGIEIAETYGEPRIRAVPSRGKGQVDARSTGIDLARGEYLCWLDDDDWWDDPGHLSLLRRHADRSRFAFRGGWIVFVDADGRESREVFDHPATPDSMLENNTILTSSIAYRRELHATLGPLDRELGGYCDWDFMLRMCAAGVTPEKLPGPCVCYSIHGSNLSTAFDAPERRLGFERFAAKHGLTIRIANHERIHRMLSEMDEPQGWSEVDGALEREFEFEGFPAAIAFVNRVAELAESENHHPDIAVSYKRVTLRWRTHSADAITDSDRAMAARSASLA